MRKHEYVADVRRDAEYERHRHDVHARDYLRLVKAGLIGVMTREKAQLREHLFADVHCRFLGGLDPCCDF